MKDINNLSDQELDDLFKSLNSESVPEFSEAAWKDMQTKLDESDRNRRFAFLWKTTAVLLIIATACVFINYFRLSSPNSVKPANSNNLINKSEGLETTTAPTEFLAKPKVNGVEQKGVGNSNLNTESIEPYKPVFDAKSSKASRSKRPSFDLKTVNKPFNRKDANIQDEDSDTFKSSILIKNEQSEKIIEVDENDKIASNLKSTNKVAQSQEVFNVEDTEEVSYSDTKIALNENNAEKINQLTTLDKEELETPNAKAKRQQPSLIIGVSPDYSKVKASEMNSMGSNFQLLLNVPLSKRLSIKTGLILSNKKYQTNGSDYGMPDKWLLNGNKLVSVGADCSVLDFPVLISYDLTQNSKNNFYGSVGFTSYKMVSELYSFNYENNQDPNIVMSQWEGESKFQPFGLLNLSIGYERKINDKLSLQVEPFLKSPLKQIGMGSVMLESYGVFINLKFNPLK